MMALLSQVAPKKTLSLFVLFLLFSELIIGGILLPYQQAQAVVDIIGGPSGILNFIEGMIDDAIDWAADAYESAGTWVSAAVDMWEQSNTILKEALKVAWNIMRKMLLNMLVNDIIAWVNGDQAKPKFVTDWQGFLKSAADKAAGQLLDKMGAGFLCTKFSFQLRLALNTPSAFDEAATCTLSSVISNINNFMTDFSKGGWAGWVKISESQNNYMGAYLYAFDEKYAIIAKAADAAKNEGVSSTGFLGDKVCTQQQKTIAGGGTQTQDYSGATGGWKEGDISTGWTCSKWTTRTPGRQVGDALQQATGIDIEGIISAKEFAEYAGAIATAVINRAIKEGVALMGSSAEGTSAGATGPGITTAATGSVDISTYNTALTNTSATATLVPQLELLEENIQNAIDEYQTNLGILNNIKTSQINSLTTLKNYIQGGCTPLPAGVSVSNIAGTSSTAGTCTPAGAPTNCPCNTTTTENVKLSSTGIGEATLRKTTTQNYKTDMTTFACSVDSTSISYSILSTTPAVNSEIATINATITDLQDQIADLTTASADTSAYETAANAYLDAYEDWAAGDLTAATSTTEVAMNAAETQAIDSLQIAIPSSLTEFTDLNQEAMQKNNDIAQEMGRAMTARGGSTDCAYTGAGLYKDLCNAQTKETSYQTALTTCTSSP